MALETYTLMQSCLEDDNNDGPNWVQEEEEDSNGVWNATTLCEGITEPTGGSNMLLQEVTTDDKTNGNAYYMAPYVIRNESRRHHNE